MNTFTVRRIYAARVSTNGAASTKWPLTLLRLEHVVVLHPTLGEGDPVKLLGLLVDHKLVMDAGIEKMLTQAKSKAAQYLGPNLIIM